MGDTRLERLAIPIRLNNGAFVEGFHAITGRDWEHFLGWQDEARGSARLGLPATLTYRKT